MDALAGLLFLYEGVDRADSLFCKASEDPLNELRVQELLWRLDVVALGRLRAQVEENEIERCRFRLLAHISVSVLNQRLAVWRIRSEPKVFGAKLHKLFVCVHSNELLKV